MTYQDPVQSYSGSIREVALGAEGRQVVAGGARTMPFYAFDGAPFTPPLIAMEVYDARPHGWPAAAEEPFADVLDDPVAWGRRCVEEHGADMVCLQLASTDPNGADAPPEAAAEVARKVAEGVDAPLVVYGSGNAIKDAEVLKAVAEACAGHDVVLGPAVEDNYKQVGAAALGYSHLVSGESPIDVNMAKQLNILLTQLGLGIDRLLTDPSVGALGYGLEYAYTVIERLRLAALAQNDAMTQSPIVCQVGREAWRVKEARASEEEEPSWGDAGKRGVLWEATTALSLALAGGDVIVMRHPDAVALVRAAFSGLGA
ncbi:MAG: acetyl-CoA decarbonylase/synthase complex subunit delta [Coriobacteriia bacterium]|nr:acetyl-CoA decarbonylase/synthase complex subunit delta [Coriobacteriia bacterium]